MKEKQTQMWIPFYVDKWIFGSTRIELEPAERSVFVDLLMLSAKDNGFIRANEKTPYPHLQLSGLLNIPVELLDSTVEKCLHFEKLTEPIPGIYFIKNWDTYKLTDDYIYRINTGKREIPGSPKKSDNCPKNSKKTGPIREDKRREEKRRERVGTFVPPTIDQVKAYCKERGNSVCPDTFVAYYQTRGWKLKGYTMKDWQAAVRTWERGEYIKSGSQAQKQPINSPSNEYKPEKYDPKGWEPLKGGK